MKSIPSGYVVLETRISTKTGEVKSSFVRDGKSLCKTADGDFLTDLLSTNVNGFGAHKIDDNGRTAEYWEQTKPQSVGPLPDEEEDFKPQKPQKKLDQGYGV
jgi:hypothetical protein